MKKNDLSVLDNPQNLDKTELSKVRSNADLASVMIKSLLNDTVTKRSDDELIKQKEMLLTAEIHELNNWGATEFNSQDSIILEQVNNMREDDVSNMIENTLRACQDNSNLNGKRGLIGYAVRLINPIKTKLSDIKRHYSTMQEHLQGLADGIADKISKIEVYQNDLRSVLNGLVHDYYIYKDNVFVYNMAIKELEDQLDEWEKSNSDESDIDGYMKKEGIKYRLQILRYKAESEFSFAITAKQDIKNCTSGIMSYKTLENNYNMIKNQVLKMWKTALALRAHNAFTASQLDFTSKIKETSNAIYLDNAMNLSENNIRVSLENSKPLIEVKTIEDVTVIMKKELDTILKNSGNEFKNHHDRMKSLQIASKKLDNVLGVE